MFFLTLVFLSSTSHCMAVFWRLFCSLLFDWTSEVQILSKNTLLTAVQRAGLLMVLRIRQGVKDGTFSPISQPAYIPYNGETPVSGNVLYCLYYSM